jgi:uncharacterized protein (DUF3084 family)
MLGGYILIGSILILGGIIAVSGDRIGTKVGKARLTIFKLRPRQTATLITIVAGTIISGLVLTLIFGANEQLRTGVFDLQKIQNKLSETKADLDDAIEQKDRVERELDEAKNARTAEKGVLLRITKSLKDELLKQSTAAQDIKNTEQQLIAVSKERNELVQSVAELTRKRDEIAATKKVTLNQIDDLKNQTDTYQQQQSNLRTKTATADRQKARLEAATNTASVSGGAVPTQTEELAIVNERIDRLTAEIELTTNRIAKIQERISGKQKELLEIETTETTNRQQLEIEQTKLQEKNRQHQQLGKEFERRGADLKLREEQLKKLESQLKIKGQGLATLEKEVNHLEREYKKIREGNIRILRNQVLAATVLKSTKPEVAAKEIESLLSQANNIAIQSTQADANNATSNKQIVKTLPNQLAQLKERISNRGEYVVRVFAAGNYVVGDENIQVFVDATPNEKVYSAGEVIASISIDPQGMSESQIRQQLDILMFTVQRRARQAGLLDEMPRLDRGQFNSYVRAIEQIENRAYPIEVKAIVQTDTYTADRLTIDFKTSSSNRRSS